MGKGPIDKARAWRNRWGSRHVWIVIGWLLILISPLIGAIPGPGFVIIFPIGLALVLKNSKWAKRQYLRLSRRFPDYGRWADWALRRRKAEGRPPFPDIWGDIKSIVSRRKGRRKLD